MLGKFQPQGVAYYLNSRFQAGGSSPFGATMFTEDHMRVLQPMFIESLLHLPFGFSREDLESSMFPKYFVKSMACNFATGMSQCITIQGTGRHDGKFWKEGDRFTAPFRREIVELHDGGLFLTYLFLAKSELCNNDRAILCRRVKGDQTLYVLWKGPYSQNLSLPPVEPWIPVGIGETNRKPKIKYN